MDERLQRTTVRPARVQATVDWLRAGKDGALRQDVLRMGLLTLQAAPPPHTLGVRRTPDGMARR